MPAAVRYTACQAAFSTPDNSLQSPGSHMYSIPDTSLHNQPLASSFVPVAMIRLQRIPACPTAYPALCYFFPHTQPACIDCDLQPGLQMRFGCQNALTLNAAVISMDYPSC